MLLELVDAHGWPRQLVGKSAYFGTDLLPTSACPCRILVRRSVEDIEDDVATVSTWWVASIDDVPICFEVPAAVLVPLAES
ncbi:hypothetical protein WEH80_07345 [Actinomycetes bacterium KLBMP 9759]